MNLREVIERYANAVSSRDYWDNLIADPRTRKRELDSAMCACEETGKLLDALIDEAEAALAHAEYQVRVHSYAPVDSATYIRERGELWDAYMEARAKAKAINQQ